MNKVVSVIVIVITLFGLTVVAAGAVSNPGSEEDPVVTKSYVDAQIAQIKGTGGTSLDIYKPVSLSAGQQLIGNEGTEIILRSGEATAIDNGANGVSDITGAKDLMTGYWVYQNHLILIPRSDGRGITATTDIVVLI